MAMAQRERLGHLKFMQRAKLREEQEKKAMEDDVAVNENQWVVPANLKSSGTKCIVIVEGDPMPSSSSGRMSFQNYNPSVETMKDQVSQKSASQNSTVIS